MTRTLIAWGLAFFVASVASAQLPLLHYHFNEGGAPATASNAGTLSPGPSLMTGFTQTGTSPNTTACLRGTGSMGEITTPLTMTLGNNSWSVGFCIKNGAVGGFQYAFSENSANGFRAFTNGAAGAGNLRLTGTSLPTIDVVGGGGDAGWVHVAFVHDSVANLIRAYLDGVLVSSTAAPGVNLTSGNAFLIGRNTTGPLLAGTLIDDFRLYDTALVTSQVAGWAQACLDGKPEFRKLMLSEVSWTSPRAIEITNFGLSLDSLVKWRIKWVAGSTITISDQIQLQVAPGESVVILAGSTVEQFPTGTQVVNRFPSGIPAPSGAFSVALLDPIGTVADEVHVSDLLGGGTAPELGGTFRGLAVRSSGPGNRSVERIWGLDSDGGRDWTEQVGRTLGRENTSDGIRGSDGIVVPVIKINEIDDSADYIELYNPGGGAIDLSGWFLWMSPDQGLPHTAQTLPAGTSIPGGGYLVLGDSGTPPSEIPGGVGYVNIVAIPYGTPELDCALYDGLGRLVDLVRATGATGQVVHNLPRAPSHWSDFTGAAARNLNGGDDAIGRNASSADTNSGADWFPIYARTMGSANVATSQAGPAGLGDVLDVRLDATGLGLGFQAIINAGSSASNLTYNFIVSTTHSHGLGPILGLGADVFANFATFYHVQPFWGLLNASGSGRIEFNPGTLPPGVNADFIFFLQNASDAVVRRTQVLEFDT